ERGEPSLPLRIILACIQEDADAPHPLALGVRRERPRCRAANQRDELAPLHSITSSAATSSLSRTARPSILAVEARLADSKLLDRTTGNSAGFAPLRMRPA